MTSNRESRVSTHGFFSHASALVESAHIGEGTKIWAYSHVMKGAMIGTDCNIGDHCYIEDGARIGNEVVVKNGVSIWQGVTLEDRVFVGPNVAFTNDLMPRAKVFHSEYVKTVIREGASLGANVTLVCPVEVGRHAMIGAGAVVTHDVPDFGLAYGNPARLVAFVCQCGSRLPIELATDGDPKCSCGKRYQKWGSQIREVSSGATS
jgi:UDP-2-acetamido-3-amino-2,3-dideoxy-glucuronate N-acetyltransferase